MTETSDLLDALERIARGREVQRDGHTEIEDVEDAMGIAERALFAHRAALADSGEDGFQARVAPWMQACFGEAIAADVVERNHRFLEESLELVQAQGCSAEEAHRLVDYTFGRPIGEPSQEVGGVMVTLAALCLAAGLDMHACGETELARINVPETIEKIRRKQASKPKESPLPERASPPSEDGGLREALAANERDRSTAATVVTALDKALARYGWLCEGRGSYAYDDDRWRDEFKNAFDEIELAFQPLKRLACDLSNCPKTQAEVIQARAALDASPAAAKASEHESALEVIKPPYRISNLSVPGGRLGERIVGFRINQGDEAYGETGTSEPLLWFDKFISSRVVLPSKPSRAASELIDWCEFAPQAAAPSPSLPIDEKWLKANGFEKEEGEGVSGLGFTSSFDKCGSVLVVQTVPGLWRVQIRRGESKTPDYARKDCTTRDELIALFEAVTGQKRVWR